MNWKRMTCQKWPNNVEITTDIVCRYCWLTGWLEFAGLENDGQDRRDRNSRMDNERLECGRTGKWRTGKWRIAPIRFHTTLPGIYHANSLSIAINWVTVCQRRCFSCPAPTSHNIDELLDFVCIFWCKLTNNNTNVIKIQITIITIVISKSSIFVSITMHKKNRIVQRTSQIKCS